MGSSHKGSCECGYEVSVTVGGNRKTHLQDSSFPCYCEKCGLVNVNIAQALLQCPWCKSQEVTPYGHESVSNPIERWPTLQWGEFQAPGKGNLCPECKKRNLKFSSAYLMFD